VPAVVTIIFARKTSPTKLIRSAKPANFYYSHIFKKCCLRRGTRLPVMQLNNSIYTYIYIFLLFVKHRYNVYVYPSQRILLYYIIVLFPFGCCVTTSSRSWLFSSSRRSCRLVIFFFRLSLVYAWLWCIHSPDGSAPITVN